MCVDKWTEWEKTMQPDGPLGPSLPFGRYHLTAEHDFKKDICEWVAGGCGHVEKDMDPLHVRNLVFRELCKMDEGKYRASLT